MIELKIQDKKFLCPESWDDVTCSVGINYFNAKLNKADKSDLISILTGIPIETLGQLSVRSVEVIISKLMFAEDESVFFEDKPKEEYKDFDYGSLKYKQTERVRQIIDIKKSLFGNSIPVFKYIFDIDLEEEPLVEWVGTLNFFLNSWIDFMAQSSDTSKEATGIVHRYRRASENSTDLDHSPLVLS